jgi:myo-inositol 2-dehydrogenase / D-chiro-inositol 1-dehydrogenase
MTQTTKPLRLGLIGCGRVAEERHLPILARVPGVQVTALSDVDQERLTRTANKFRIANTYTDYRMLLQSDVDAVAVLAPTQFHAEIGCAAIDAGKHLFIEKPLAPNLRDCDELIAHAHRASVKIAVGFNMRAHRLVRRAQALLQKNEIGAIKAVKSSFTHWRPTPPSWKRKRASGGGVVINEAIHHFDLWRFLLHSEIAQIYAVSQPSEEYEDETSIITARMTNGALATGVFSLKTSQNNEIEFYGATGRAYLSLYRFDGLTTFSNETFPGDWMDRVRKGVGTIKEIPALLPLLRHGGAFLSSYDTEWLEFVECIRQDKPPTCTLEDGKRATQAALAAVASLERGQPVEIGS